MLKRWKVPERDLSFDEDLYQEELAWLKRDQQGLLLHGGTPPEVGILILGSFFLSIVIGASIGAIIAFFTRTFIPFFVSIIIVFLISFLAQKRPYSEMALDTQRPFFEYSGVILYAGDEKTGRYRGPIEIIEASELIRKGKKKYLRFTTNSGYLSIRFEEGSQFNVRLHELGLIDLDVLEDAIQSKTLLSSADVDVIYRTSFDRSEFKQELKKMQEKKKKKLEKEKEERNQRLIERSRELKKKKR